MQLGNLLRSIQLVGIANSVRAIRYGLLRDRPAPQVGGGMASKLGMSSEVTSQPGRSLA